MHRTCLLLLALAFAVPSTAEEFQVNTYTTGSQRGAALTWLTTGEFVVVWESDGAPGDTSFYSVQGRLLDTAGVPMGAPFQVNTTTAGFQRSPDTAFLGGGEFVVVWQSTDLGVGSTYEIMGRRFAADGTPVTDEFQINTYTTGNQRRPTVTVSPAGTFVVAWASEGSMESDTDGTSVQAQRFSAAGDPQGLQFQVNTYTTGDQGIDGFRALDITSAPDGGFMITWQSPGSTGTDTDTASIQAQRYDIFGNPLGAEFQVNSFTTGPQRFPRLDSLFSGTGEVNVVWESGEPFGVDGPDGDDTGIALQRFSPTGTPLGSEVVLNTTTAQLQRFPAIATDFAGPSAVVWQSLGVDGSSFAIQGQRLDAAGAPVGDEFQVNTYTTGAQTYPAVSAVGEQFVVVWSSAESTTDPDGSIQVRTLPLVLPLFADGFESGDTTAWSTTVP